MIIRARPVLLAISAVTILLLGLLYLAPDYPARAATSLFPDLKTLPPTELKFDTEEINGSIHHVLRFTTRVWNRGAGPLELRGERVSANRTVVYQRLYDDNGEVTEIEVGKFVYHPAHQHWHFEDFAVYELWTKANYDAWLSNGKGREQAIKGSKVTFCIRDDIKIRTLPGTPARKRYTDCDQKLQGISVGWADVYKYSLPDQWIDLGTSPLPRGEYVLKAVVDPSNRITESAGNDRAREGPEANGAVTFFTVGASSSLAIGLTSGRSVSETVREGEFKHYYIDVPPGTKRLLTRTTGSKDVDLYIRKNKAPNLSRWDFRGYTSSGNERISINKSTVPELSPGRWYISVQGYARGTTRFTLRATAITD